MVGGVPARTETREDTYLLNLQWLSVKIHGGGALEVKVYRGSPGILEAWQKWSFPLARGRSYDDRELRQVFWCGRCRWRPRVAGTGAGTDEAEGEGRHG